MFDASTKSEADKGKKKRRRHSLFSFFSFSVLGGAPCFPFRSCRRAAPIPTSRPPTRDSPLDAWSIGKTIGGGRDSRIRTRESWMKKIEKKWRTTARPSNLISSFLFFFLPRGPRSFLIYPKSLLYITHHHRLLLSAPQRPPPRKGCRRTRRRRAPAPPVAPRVPRAAPSRQSGTTATPSPRRRRSRPRSRSSPRG